MASMEAKGCIMSPSNGRHFNCRDAEYCAAGLDSSKDDAAGSDPGEVVHAGLWQDYGRRSQEDALAQVREPGHVAMTAEGGSIANRDVMSNAGMYVNCPEISNCD